MLKIASNLERIKTILLLFCHFFWVLSACCTYILTVILKLYQRIHAEIEKREEKEITVHAKIKGCCFSDVGWCSFVSYITCFRVKFISWDSDTIKKITNKNLD